MKYPGFCGGTYAGRSITPAGDRCINLYPESTTGAGAPENAYILLGTPGHKLFSALPTLPVQKIYNEPATDRIFVIAGRIFYEVLSDGTFVSYGLVDAGYYTFASNGLQVMFTCANVHTGWIFTLATSALQKITSLGFLGADGVQMIDNYFITRLPSPTREFQICAPLDGLTWDASDVALAEGGPDNLVGMLADHRELWLFSSKHAEVFTDTGAALFPFERISSVYVEMGLLATESLIQLDNTIFFLGQNQHGWARVFRMDAYTPVGVSNRAVEYFFNEYAKNGGIADAKAFGYQDEDGHSFFVITFPSATSDISSTGGMQNGVVTGATWAYDITEKQWHERQYMNPTTGGFGQTLSTYHAFGFGKHLVGGGDGTGNIYDMSVDTYTDNLNPIKRIRRAPHVVDELKRIVYAAFRLSAQVGTGPVGDAFNKATLRVSNDGGLTWSNEYDTSLGDAGQFDTIVEWRCLGSAFRRAFEVSTTIKSAVSFVDAFLRIGGESK